MLNPKTAACGLALGVASMLWASGVIPAIVPAAVPTANKTGNSALFQLQTGTHPVGDCPTWDVSGNLVSSGFATCGGAGTSVSSAFGQTGAVNIPVTTTDIATPAAPAAGATKWYTKAGALCAISPASAETCTTVATTGALTIAGMYLFDGTNYFTGLTNQQATLPVGASFAWINQGGASEATVQNALVMTAPISVSDSLRIRKQTMGANTILTALLIPSKEMQNYRVAFVCFRESATGKIIVLGFINSTNAAMNVTRYSSATAFASAALDTGAVGLGLGTWQRLELAGANINFYVSSDGVNFVKIWSEAKNSFFTTGPDEWGYGLNLQGNTPGQSSDGYATLLSWKMQ